MSFLQKKVAASIERASQWRPADSIARSTAGRMSPLTTIAVIKDFLQRQGMDNQSWNIADIKDLTLPSMRITKPVVTSQILRAPSRCLISRNENALDDVRKILSSPKSRQNYNVPMIQVTADSPTSVKSDHAKEKNAADPDFEVQGKRKSGKTCKDCLQKGSFTQNDLFKLPRDKLKTFDREYEGKISRINEAKEKDTDSSVGSLDYYFVCSAEESPSEASVTRLFDFLDDKYFLEGTKTSTSNGCESKSGEHNGKVSGERQGFEERNITVHYKNNREGGTSSKRKTLRSKQASMVSEKQGGTKPLEVVLRGGHDGRENAEYEEREIPDFEVMVQRFNEVSPLISGFNKRYPKLHVSFKHLVNHMNHRRLVKKFYGFVDSQRLNANFSPQNLLLSSRGLDVKQGNTLQRRKNGPGKLPTGLGKRDRQQSRKFITFNIGKKLEKEKA